MKDPTQTRKIKIFRLVLKRFTQLVKFKYYSNKYV